MTIEVLVEEPSMEKALRHLLPKIVQGRARVKPINMRNKSRLLKELPNRLRAYRRRMDKGERLRILVLVDRDSEDCKELKNRLETMARAAGLRTKASPDNGDDFHVVIRIVIEELESWFMGDEDALRSAFTRLRGVGFPKTFKNPDNGGRWERLHQFLRKHGIYPNSYPKIEAAQKIAPHMDPSRNRSRSFQCFREGVEAFF